MKVFVKKICKDYFKYNPDGDLLYAINHDEQSKIPYIEEVGLFNKEDQKLGNDSLGVSFGGDFFHVYKYKKGLSKTPLGAKRKLIKMIKENNNQDGFYI